MNMNTIMVASVMLTTNQLSDDELVVLNNFANGFGHMPTDHPLFEKVKNLFNKDGTVLHSDIQDALAQIALRRLT